jgi:hypothetical protein
VPMRDSSNIHQVVRTSARRTYHVSRAAADLALTAGRAHQQRGVAAWGSSASVALKYKKLKSAAGFQTTPVEERLFRLAGDVATVSGGILAAVALPAMAKKTATSFRELTDLIHQPTATAEARLDKLEEMARSTAGTVFSAQGVVVGAKGTIGILSRSEGVARAAASVGNSRWFQLVSSPFGRVLNVLLPVADVAVLVGESIATRRTFLDPSASGWNKSRKLLDLSLATLKTAFWLLPAARPLKALYAGASFLQLGLALRDFWPTVQPALENAARGTLWAVAHPIQATRALGNEVNQRLQGLGATVGRGLSAVWGVVSHPRAVWTQITTTLSSWLGILRGEDLGPRPASETGPGLPTPLNLSNQLPVPALASASFEMPPPLPSVGAMLLPPPPTPAPPPPPPPSVPLLP